jgi:hypothetical protein
MACRTRAEATVVVVDAFVARLLAGPGREPPTNGPTRPRRNDDLDRDGAQFSGPEVTS